MKNKAGGNWDNINLKEPLGFTRSAMPVRRRHAAAEKHKRRQPRSSGNKAITDVSSDRYTALDGTVHHSFKTGVFLLLLVLF